MKKSILTIMIILMLAISFAFTLNVEAKDNLVLNVDKNQVKAGENITVSIDIESDTTSLYAYSAKLSYDEEVFDVIKEEDFKGQENWSDIVYNKENNKFALTNKKGESGDKLLEFTLKVKNDAKGGKTAITVNNIVASDGKKDIKIDGQSIEVTVQKDGLSESESITDNNIDVPTEEDSTIKVEKSFSWSTLLLVILLLVLISCVIYFITKKKGLKNINTIIAILSVLAVVTAIALVFVVKNINKKDADVDENGLVDYEDPKYILEYILEIKKPQNDDELEDKDLNGDGELTVTDVAQIVDRAKEQNYNASIVGGEEQSPSTGNQSSSAGSEQPPFTGNQSGSVSPEQPPFTGNQSGPAGPEQPNYSTDVKDTYISNVTPKKGENVTLDLNINLTPYTSVTAVIIDGQEYPVIKVEKNRYKLTFPAKNSAGLCDVVLSGVVLDNGKVVDTQYKVTLDILKEEPKLSEFKIDTLKEIPEISFKIIDNDNALKEAKIVVTDESENIVYESKEVQNGINSYQINNLNKIKKYNVKVDATYDLDSDKFGKPEDNRVNKTLVTQDFIIQADYGFIAKNLTITNRVTSRDALKITFENGYNSFYDVSTITVDGTTYPVTKSGSIYSAEINKSRPKGRKVVKVQSVTLKNEAKFDVNQDLSYIYLKDAPVIGDIIPSINENTLKLIFDVDDVDSAIKNIEAFLTNAAGSLVQRKEITPSQNSVSFEIDRESTYQVKLKYTYDLGDGMPVSQEKTYNYFPNAEFDMSFSEYKVVNVDTTYKKVTLEFKLELDQEYSEYYVKKVKINNVVYEVVKHKVNTYRVEVPYVGENTQKFEIQEIILDNLHSFKITENNVVAIFKKVTAEITPIVAEDISNIEVRLQIQDEYGIAENMKLELRDAHGTIETKDITKATTSETFELENKMAGAYTIRVLADYDATDGKGKVRNRIVSSQPISVPVKAVIENAEFPEYVEKNSSFLAKYTIKTNTTAKLQSIVINGVPCNVTKQEDNIYTVNVVTLFTVAGKQQVNATMLNFDGGITAKVQYTSEVEVLKSELPKIDDFKVEESAEGVILNYKIVDPEDTFINGTLTIKNTNTNETSEVEITKQEENKYTHTLDYIEKSIRYDLTFDLRYDLDQNKEDNLNVKTTQIKDKFIHLLSEYDFTLANFKVEKVDNANKEITFSFESSNASENNEENTGYPVTEVTINNNKYKTEKLDGKYIVKVPYKEEIRTEYKLQKAKLSNAKEFDVEVEKVVCFKTTPKVEITAQSNIEQNKIEATANIIDEDKTIISLEAQLIDPNDKLVETTSINTDANNKNITFTSKEDIYKAGKYKIRVNATYDAVNGKGTETTQLDKEGTVKIATRAKITEAEIVGEDHVEKNSELQVKFKFESNNDENPTSIVIGNEAIPLEPLGPQEDVTFLAKIPIENDVPYGPKMLKVDVAMYGNETATLESSENVEYYVLKAKPSIEHTFNEYLENQTLVFTLKNPDDAKISDANIVLTKEGETNPEKKEQLNTNIEGESEEVITTVELGELDEGTYKVRLEGTYERSDTSGEYIGNLSEVFEERTITISKHTATMKINTIDVNNKSVDITFTITNSSNLPLKQIVVQENPALENPNIDVTKLEGVDTYKATIPYSKEEYQTITITNLIFEHDLNIAINAGNSFEIFKTKPTVKDTVAENVENKLHVKFSIEDPHNTISGNIKAIISKDGYSEVKGIEGKDTKEVIFSIPPTEGEYDIKFYADYNAIDKLGSRTNEELQGGTKYTVDSLTTVKLDALPKTYYNKGEALTFSYTITSNSPSKPQALIFEDESIKEQAIIDNKCTVNVTTPNIYGEKTYKVIAVKFEDSSSTQVTNEEARIYVLRDAPVVTDYKLEKDKKQISFNFDKKESDIQNEKVLIKNTGGDVLQEEQLNDGENTIKLNEKVNNDSEVYTITLEGIYNLDDRQGGNEFQHNLSEIFTEKFQLNISTKLTLESVSNYYPAKGEEVTITFLAQSNTSISINKIFVGEKEYEATPLEGGKYTIKHIANKNESGVETLKIEKVAHSDEAISIENAIEIKIDVLKDKPEVKINKITQKYDENEITFDIEVADEEKAISEAHATFGNFADQNNQTQVNVQNGKQEITFKNVENGVYPFKVIATYDLDSDALGGEDKNEIQDATLVETQALLVNKDSLQILNIRAKVGETVGKYVKKKENFKVVFDTAAVGSQGTNPAQFELEAAYIGDVHYALEKSNNSYVTTEDYEHTFENAGKQEITINKIVLSNKQEVELEGKGSIEVLKDEVTLNEFKISTSEKEVKATVHITDPDSAFVSGKIVIKDLSEVGAEEDIIVELQDSATTEYDITDKIKQFKKYTATLFITTDLDSVLGGDNQLESQYGEPQTFEFGKDYNLQAENLVVEKVDKSSRKATLSFISTNSSKHKITEVKVQNHDGWLSAVHGVNGDEQNKYRFDYIASTTEKKTEIIVEKVKLDNEVELNVPSELKAEIFKKAPTGTIENVTLEEGNQVKVNFNITDEDKSLKEIYLALKNVNGESEIGETSLENVDVRTGTIHVETSGTYNVILKGSSECYDGTAREKEKLAESTDTIEINPQVTITEATALNQYPEKKDVIQLKYGIATNIEEVPTKIALSTSNNTDEEYTLTPAEEGTYIVNYTAPETAGPCDIEVVGVYFGENRVDIKNEEKTIQIDVLKDIPTIEISSLDILELSQVKFTIRVVDPDKAMIRGTARIDGMEESEKTLTVGEETSMAVKVEAGKEHILKVNVDYDRDSNNQDTENQHTLEKDEKFTLVENYNLKLNNLRVVLQEKPEETVKEVKKSERIQLRFTLENDVAIEPKSLHIVDETSDSKAELPYDIKKDENPEKPNEYYVELSAKNVAGKQAFKVTALELENSKTITTFANEVPTAEITVLKDIPTMSNFNVDNKGDTAIVTFNIKDDDNALILEESKIKLADFETETVEQSKEIKVGSNTYQFNLTEDKKYNIIIDNIYKLSEEGEKVESQFIKHELEIPEEPNFKAKHLEVTRRVKENNQATVSFENAVLSPKDVTSVKIDGIDYTVKKDAKGIYKVNLTPKKKGVNKVNVQSAKIGEKEFNISRTLEYTYEFVDPIAKDVSEIKQVGRNAQVTYKLIDTDKSIRSMKAYMKTSSGAVIATKDLKAKEGDKEGDYVVDPNVENTVEMPLMKISIYHIELRAMCDIGNGKLEEKSLFDVKIEADPKVTIDKNSVISDEYSEKGAQVTLQFKITTNVDKEVSNIYIDDKAYSVEKALDDNKKVIPDTYNVKVFAPKESGVFEQKVTKIKIGPELIETPEEGQEGDGGLYYALEDGEDIVAIKVLKDKPTVSHFIINEGEGKVTFRVNDPDKSLSKKVASNLNIKLAEGEPNTTEIPYNDIEWNKDGGYGEYDAELENIGLKETDKDYNVTLEATYDRRPDAKEESIFKKIKNFITGKKNEAKTIAESPETPPTDKEEEDPSAKWLVREPIYEDICSLTGDIDYNLYFEDVGKFYMFDYDDENNVQFYCSTGTKHMVEKVIINGKEWKIAKSRPELNKDDENTHMYTIDYLPDSVNQTLVCYDTLILDNGAAINLNECEGLEQEDYQIPALTQPKDPSFDILGFSEDDETRKVIFNFKVTDVDDTIRDELTFTLRNTQNQVIETKYVSADDTVVEFNIPDPPTSIYRLTVEGQYLLMLGEGLENFKGPFGPYTSEYKSSVTTSILGNEIKNKYPKRNETIELIYNISSTKVVLIDKDDHSNQDKAIGISSLVINGEEYSAEMLDQEEAANKDKYRVYYTAGDELGLEKLEVSNIKFTNGEEEHFERTDEIEVIKEEPKVKNFSMEENLTESKVKFRLKVEDTDSVIENLDDLYAEVDGNKENKQVLETEQDQEVEFVVNPDQLSTFQVRGNYDLGMNELEASENVNVHEDEIIFENPFVLTGNCGIDFNNIKLYNSKGEVTNVFEKGEEVKLEYELGTNYKEITPKTITIGDKEYTPEETLVTEEVPEDQVGDDGATERTKTLYTVNLQAEETAGSKQFVIKKALLNSGNKITFSDEHIDYQVLKSPIRVEDFVYDAEKDADSIDVSFKIVDEDSASTGYSMVVKDENGGIISTDYIPVTGNNNFTINRKTSKAEKYFVSISADYNRNGAASETSAVKGEQIHFEIITVNNRYIEMKDIVDIELYKHGDDGNTVKVPIITPKVLETEPVDNFLVKVKMKDMPEFYSKLLDYSVNEEHTKLTLVLEYQDAMVFAKDPEDEEKGKLTKLEVTLDIPKGEEAEGYQFAGSFESLVARMRENPNENIVLDKDYDLADYPNTYDDEKKAIIDFPFKGTIEGNGHSITNLRKPLFEKLEDATVQNLTFRKVYFSGNEHKGCVAVETERTTIKNVHVDEIILESGKNQSQNTAGIVYEAKDHTLIQECSVTKIDYRTTYLSSSDAGIACIIDNGTKIENCLVNGKMGSMRCFCAGIVVQVKNKGNADKCEISNCIVKLPMNSYYGITEQYGGGNGGITANADEVKLTNVLSLVVGNKGTPPIYNTNPQYNPHIAKDSSNVYQLDSAPLKHEDDKKITTVYEKDIDAKFYKEKLHLDEGIWTIPEDASSEKLPTLKGLTVSYNDGGSQPASTDLYIPDYNRVKNLSSYIQENEIAYHNMYKLMPFYDTKDLINDGNKINKDSPLHNQLIKYIIPYNKEGKAVTYLSTDDYNSLKDIKVVFENGETKTYHVDFDDYYGNVASYMITELNIGYNYGKFIINTHLPIIDQLVDEVEDYTFDNDLEPLTPKEDSRLYRENFENKTKHRTREFVIKTLVNLGYTPTFENDVLNNKIKQELLETGKMKEMLFAYNYFTKWYDLDMQGLNIADTLMFESDQMFDERLTIEFLGTKIVQGENSKPNNIAGFYNAQIAYYTKVSNLGLYLDHLITELTTYSDGNDWFTETFKGGIYDTVSIDKEGVNYTIWDHVKHDSNVQRDIMPLLNIPEYSIFLITSPTQVFSGSLRTYMKDPKDPQQVKKFRKDYVEEFEREVKQFYIFAYNYWGAENLNKHCDTQYDRRTTYTGKGNQTVYNNPYSTTEPYHKYFIEAIDRWAGTSGAAYANGAEVFWNTIAMLENFRVGTHETLHNQDDKIFMGGYGRRGDAEDYAAGFIQQYYNDGWVSPNIFDENQIKDNETLNINRSSVETNAKLARYYRNYFRANDFLDYVEAKAFFRLTDKEKAAVATQVSYPELKDDNPETDEGDMKVQYAPVSEEEVKKMQLNSMEALWDNRIMLRPGTRSADIRSQGADTDSIFNIHWYQPHANNSRPDGASFKYNAWQMAGERGYYDGMIAYYSNSYVGRQDGSGKATTDLYALKYITGKDSWRSYKVDRYNSFAQYYNSNEVMFDEINVVELENKFLEALKKDAATEDRDLKESKWVKRTYFKQLRANTEDFKKDPLTGKEDPLDESLNQKPTK